MDIIKTSIAPIKPIMDIGTTSVNTEDQSANFGDMLKKAVEEVNGLQQQSADMKTKLLTGQIDDIHQVMIAAEKADLSFQLTMQIRNKVVEAYQEIMRMQV